jgi:ketosteroid isomerase-like protein
MSTAWELSQKSVAAVEAGDREGWIALFAPDGVVEDPVGPSMFDETGQGHRGPAGIGAFFDAAIAGNQVRFEIREHHLSGEECANVVTITTTLPDGSKAIVDAVTVYKLAVDGEHLASMRAFWSPDEMRFEPAPG